MKKFILLTVFLTATVINASQFNVTSEIKELPGDNTAQDYPFKDVNGELCAVIIIQTEIKGIQFESTGYEKHDYRDGDYHVYMQQGSKNIRIKKDGFVAKQIEFPFKLRSNVTYGLKLNSDSQTTGEEDIAITVISDPAGAEIYIDGQNYGVKEQIVTSIGKHQLKFAKEGYQTVISDIEVSPRKTLFKVDLQKLKGSYVNINSDPAGAEVFIDGLKLGITPLSENYPEGKHKIKITMTGFASLEEDIDILKTGTKKTYKLKDERASLTINTDKKGKVFINDILTENIEDIKLPAQFAKIRIEFKKADTIEKKVLLRKNDTVSLDMYPDIKSGTLYIQVSENDAKLALIGDDGEIFKAIGSKKFTDVPIGSYKLKIKKDGFKYHSETISVLEGKEETITVTLSKAQDSSIEMVLVEGGNFTMGNNNPPKNYRGEKPEHKVTLTDYFIGKYEVTQKQWKAIMGSNPSEFKDEENPVESINWYEAVIFCNKLSEIEGYERCYVVNNGEKDKVYTDINEYLKYGVSCDFNADGYRLPTEAEWEFAARGGNKSKRFKHSGSNEINEIGWYWRNSGKKYLKGERWGKNFHESGDKMEGNNCRTHQGGKKKPNELGVYDMSGNVWEWCWDEYDFSYYEKSPSKNPTGPNYGADNVMRGGAWNSEENSCRVDNRNYRPPEFIKYSTPAGIRVVRTAIVNW